MNLKASGACGALLAAGGQSLMDDCKNKHGNQLQEGMVAEIGAGKLKCKSVYLTVLPPYTPEAESVSYSVYALKFENRTVAEHIILFQCFLKLGFLNLI